MLSSRDRHATPRTTQVHRIQANINRPIRLEPLLHLMRLRRAKSMKPACKCLYNKHVPKNRRCPLPHNTDPGIVNYRSSNAARTPKKTSRCHRMPLAVFRRKGRWNAGGDDFAESIVAQLPRGPAALSRGSPIHSGGPPCRTVHATPLPRVVQASVRRGAGLHELAKATGRGLRIDTLRDRGANAQDRAPGCDDFTGIVRRDATNRSQW